MAVSVRMEPLLEKELELAAKRRGITKSQFIVDAVERALGKKDPYALLLKVQEDAAAYHVATGRDDVAEASDIAPHKRKLKTILQTKHEAEQADWLAYQDAKRRGETWNPDVDEAAPK